MIDFKVQPDGGEEYAVTAEARDVLMWEKVSKGRTLNDIIEKKSFTDLYKLAHVASKRQGMFTGTLAEFEESCDIDFWSGGDEDDEPDPTQPDH